MVHSTEAFSPSMIIVPNLKYILSGIFSPQSMFLISSIPLNVVCPVEELNISHMMSSERNSINSSILFSSKILLTLVISSLVVAIENKQTKKGKVCSIVFAVGV